MTQLTLSKSTYLKEAKKLDSYERYLPSLDLKRKQLIIEKNKSDRRLSELEQSYQELTLKINENLQMLSNKEIQLEGMVSVRRAQIDEENKLGVVLPKITEIDIESKKFGYLTKPHWVDTYVTQLKKACELKLSLDVQKQRSAMLYQAVRRASQRVNLVAEVLIPQTKTNMRKIKIFLGDNERVAVVRSKIAKRKKNLVTST